MNIELLYAFRTLHKVTKIKPQQKLQSEYLNQSYRRVLINNLRRGVIAKYLYFSELFRIFFFIILRKNEEGHDTEMLYLSATVNQARQLEYMRDVFSDKEYMTVSLRGSHRIRFLNIFQLFSCLGPWSAALRYYRAFFDRHSYIDYKNYVLFMCMYVYAKRLLKAKSPKALLVANDHSPIPLGFACAARSLGIKTLYIQHAHITYDLPYLRFDLAILDGECALDIYKDQGSIGDTRVVYRGLEGVERDMNTQPIRGGEGLTVGLFVNVFMDEKLFEILDVLKSHPQIEKIIVREHPAFPLDIPAEKIPEGVVMSGRHTSLWDDAEQCDVIIGGNSSFHLSVLKYGIPTVFYDDLDFVKYDDYSFIKHDILYEAKDLEKLDLKAVAEYYDAPDWIRRFQYFDAGYQSDEAALKKKVRETIESSILNTEV